MAPVILSAKLNEFNVALISLWTVFLLRFTQQCLSDPLSHRPLSGRESLVCFISYLLTPVQVILFAGTWDRFPSNLVKKNISVGKTTVFTSVGTSAGSVKSPTPFANLEAWPTCYSFRGRGNSHAFTLKRGAREHFFEVVKCTLPGLKFQLFTQR